MSKRKRKEGESKPTHKEEQQGELIKYYEAVISGLIEDGKLKFEEWEFESAGWRQCVNCKLPVSCWVEGFGQCSETCCECGGVAWCGRNACVPAPKINEVDLKSWVGIVKMCKTCEKNVE